MLSKKKGTVCRMLTVLFVTILILNLKGTATVRAAEQGKVLDAVSEDGDYALRKQRYQIVKALNALRRLGLSPVDIVDRILGGEISIPDASELTEFTDEITDGITEKIPEISEIPGLSEDTAESISDVADTVSEAGSEIAQAAQDAAEQAQEQAEKGSEEIVEGAKKSLREKLYEIIDSIIDKL